jgi:CHASE4 domain
MLLVFAITLVLGAGLVYITSRRIVVSSFRQLERRQMERDVEFAISGLDLEFRNLADSANDYAYWDRMYEYMLNPKKADISGEFLDNEMAQLNFSLVVIRNTQGEIVFLHSYNPGNPGQGGPSREFLRGIFALEPMGSEAIAMRPEDAATPGAGPDPRRSRSDFVSGYGPRLFFSSDRPAAERPESHRVASRNVNRHWRLESGRLFADEYLHRSPDSGGFVVLHHAYVFAAGGGRPGRGGDYQWSKRADAQ